MAKGQDLSKAGEVLLLVGAILSAVGALFMVMLAVGMTALFAALGEPEGAWISILYGAFAVLMVGSAIFGFMGWNRARAGDLSGGFLFGLISSLLPPVQIIPLLGAIFCKVSED